MSVPTTMNESSAIDGEFLRAIADKIQAIPKMDYYNNPPQFNEGEQDILDALRPIVAYLMYDEIVRLNHKIKNHHHIGLSVEDGMNYRNNGMKVSQTKVNGVD